MIERRAGWAAAAALAMFAFAPALADSPTYTTPHLSTATGQALTAINGRTFSNQGLVAVGRLKADVHDFNGETLGSFSGMAARNWTRNADGSYSGTLLTLPDRGPNNVGGLPTTNYAARLERLSVSLNGSGLKLTPEGGLLLRDSTGQLFTGRDPGKGSLTRDGITYPSPPKGDLGADRISLDPEALALLPDGSFYVGDEYGPLIYYFGADGRQLGTIAPTNDIAPKVGGQTFFGVNDNPVAPGSTGRRANQGLEGVSVSPDGRRLFAVLQSAPLQDNLGNQDVQRNTTRVLVYDLTKGKTPSRPMAEHVLQLPTFRAGGDGKAADKTAAQSEILAVNARQFLMLSRDGGGRGSGSSRPIVYKSILIVDLIGATNILGTPYETDAEPVIAGANATGSTLKPNIVPVQIEEVVNMLHPAQLAKFGLNLNTSPSNASTLSEKWESMAAVRALDPEHPDDFFLLVGNDNDFRTAHLDAAGLKNASTALTDAASGTGDVDNMVLVYRVGLPAWEDEAPPPPTANKKPPSKKKGGSSKHRKKRR